MDGKKHLRIYMNDHIASATAAAEVSKRAAASNRGTELGDFLEGCAREFREEQRFLEEIISKTGSHVAVHKKAAGWLAEKAGRLKLNGQLVGYSPLSRVVELEGLGWANDANLSLWLRLRNDTDEILDDAKLDAFIARAEARRRLLQDHVSAAGKIAFARPDQ